MMGSLYQLNPHCFLSLSPSLVWQQIPAPLSFAPQLLSQQRLAALLSTQSLSPHLAPWVNSHPSQERSSPRLEGSTSLLQLCHKHLTRLPAWPSDQPNSPDKQDMNITNAMMRLGLCYWAESQRKHSLYKKPQIFSSAAVLLCSVVESNGHCPVPHAAQSRGYLWIMWYRFTAIMNLGFYV